MYKKALELNPGSDEALGSLVRLCEETGRPQLAREYEGRKERLRSGTCNLLTVNNYRSMKEILDRRGVRLVCVQYPMRRVAFLKQIFSDGKGVVFVDNEQVFKEAVKKDGFEAYFRDSFGGDFGHCTEKGNRLLAGNIARVILREIPRFNGRPAAQEGQAVAVSRP
jgi:hypothetical protein